jgi:hypothetical protein
MTKEDHQLVEEITTLLAFLLPYHHCEDKVMWVAKEEADLRFAAKSIVQLLRKSTEAGPHAPKPRQRAPRNGPTA